MMARLDVAIQDELPKLVSELEVLQSRSVVNPFLAASGPEAAPDEWAIDADSLERYTKTFAALQLVDGFASGSQVKAVLMKSKLDTPLLTKVRRSSEFFEEFSIHFLFVKGSVI